MPSRSKNGFKRGDIVCPLLSRKQSNYWKLTQIEELRVTRVFSNEGSIQCEIIKGAAREQRSWATKYASQGDEIWIHDNSITYVKPKTDTYEIF